MASNNPWRGWIQLLFGMGLTFLFFYMMAPFVVALLLGAVMAILAQPLFQKLSHKLPRPLAGGAVTLGVTLGCLLPLVFLLFRFAHQLITLSGRMKMKLPDGEQVKTLIQSPVVTNLIDTASRFVPLDKSFLREQALGLLQSIGEGLSGALGSFLSGAPNFFLGLSLVVISLYFFLVDGGKFLHFLSDLSPIKANRSELLYRTFEGSCRGVVIGLLASALAQGAIITVFLLITGIPNAITWGIAGIFMGMIPMVGVAPITIGSTIYLFASGNIPMGVVMIVGAILIGAVDNVVRTLVMQDQSEMHPLLALVSVFGAVHLLGATGISLGPIIAAVFVSFLKIIAMDIQRENVDTAGA